MIFNHVKKLKADGKRIGITFSTFDMLHAGHIAMLSDAKNHCDYLIAGLQTDPTIDRPDTKNKPVQSLLERFIQLKSIRYVDEVYPYETESDLENLIGILDIQKRFIGYDHYGEVHTGQALCIHRNIEIIYNKRFHHWSSSRMRNKLNEF